MINQIRINGYYSKETRYTEICGQITMLTHSSDNTLCDTTGIFLACQFY